MPASGWYCEKMFQNTIIVGRMTRNAELQKTQEDRSFTNVTLAVQRSHKNLATGEFETDFINVVLWGANADKVVEYCGKGSVIGIRGRLITRTYEVPNFKAIRTTEVVGDRVSFINTRRPADGTVDADTDLTVNLPADEDVLAV